LDEFPALDMAVAGMRDNGAFVTMKPLLPTVDRVPAEHSGFALAVPASGAESM